MAEMNEQVIAELAAGNQKIRIRWVDQFGRKFLDVRRFYRFNHGEGLEEYRPTKKGVFIPYELVPTFIEVIKDLEVK